MQISTREVRPNDAEAVNALSIQLGYSLSIAETRTNLVQSLLKPENACFVAVHNECVIGWIHVVVRHTIESSPFAEISGLVVDERFRGQGIGTALIERIKEWSLQQAVSTLRLRSNVKRTAAHHFYSNLGFSITKEQKVFEIRLHEKKLRP